MNAKAKLIKDIIIAVAGFGIVYLICAAGGAGVSSGDLVGCLFCSGIIFGWRWANSVFTATSLYGVVIKVVLAVALGFIAMPVALIGDIVAVFNESTN